MENAAPGVGDTPYKASKNLCDCRSLWSPADFSWDIVTRSAMIGVMARMANQIEFGEPKTARLEAELVPRFRNFSYRIPGNNCVQRDPNPFRQALNLVILSR